VIADALSFFVSRCDSGVRVDACLLFGVIHQTLNNRKDFIMQTTFKIFISCFLCLAVMLLSGCGGGGLSKAEKEKADKILADNGKNAIQVYILNPSGNPDVDTQNRFIKYFISKGADVNVICGLGDSRPIHRAVGDENYELVKLLVSKGADINAEVFLPASGYVTPLEMAETRDNKAIIKFLVSKGAKRAK